MNEFPAVLSTKYVCFVKCQTCPDEGAAVSRGGPNEGFQYAEGEICREVSRYWKGIKECAECVFCSCCCSVRLGCENSKGFVYIYMMYI